MLWQHAPHHLLLLLLLFLGQSYLAESVFGENLIDAQVGDLDGGKQV